MEVQMSGLLVLVKYDNIRLIFVMTNFLIMRNLYICMSIYVYWM